MRLRAIRVAAVCVGLLLGAPQEAGGGEPYVFDRFHSTVGFSVKYLGLTAAEGRFTDFSGTIVYDANDLTRSSVTAVIKTASINTALEFRDNDLRSADWLDAEKHPAIVFQSGKITRRDQGLLMTGTLTLHGVTREITFPVTFVGQIVERHPRIAFEARTRLKRTDFGVVGNKWFEGRKAAGVTAASVFEMVADEVEISLRIQAQGINYSALQFFSRGKPSIGEVLMKTILESGVQAGIAQYRELKEKQPDAYDFREPHLNILGYMLLGRKKFDEAVEVFKLTAEVFPKSANAWDSLAYAYASSGNKEKAVEAYRKSLELDPHNANALELLRSLSRD